MKNWVIQENLLDSKQIADVCFAVKNDGGNVYPVKVIPFSDEIDFFWDEPPTKDVVLYGSAKMSKLAYKKGWAGLFFNDNFDTGVWAKHRDDMLNQNPVIIRAGDVIKYFEDQHIDDEELFFIRPVLDLKAFAGGVQSVKEIKEHMGSTHVENYSFDVDTMVSMDVPRNILGEWRWFIVNGKVINGSQYRRMGQPHRKQVTIQVRKDHAQELADKWLPHPNCVMDLAMTSNGWKVVEFNCINSSGFYDNDIPKIVQAINRSF